MTAPPSHDGAPGVLILGAVLAGGVGRRFGGDKTKAEVGGLPMIRRAWEALSDSCEEVVVVSSRADTPEGPWRVTPDLRPAAGPLAGIEAALTALGEAVSRSGGAERQESPGARGAVAVLAADMPLVDGVAVARLVDAYRGADARVQAVAAARNGEPPFEPLCAVYSMGCLPVATALLDEGRWAAVNLFSAMSGLTVALGDAASMNVNTREDRALAEARLRASAGLGSPTEKRK